jgi:hypothetical protein
MSQDASRRSRTSDSEPARIGLDEFTEVTVRSVVRALGVRQGPEGDFKLPFPIIYGIWIGPEGPFGPAGPFQRSLAESSQED